ncbi:MAG: LpqB family beta-propeller domain-containing protein [Fuerstiella sp.]|nr:LpqB family beta-propeller domain-containing protein [Fuerstiella sp.]
MSFFDRVCLYAVACLVVVVCAGQHSQADSLRLTSDGILKASPVYCKDGTELVYALLENAERYCLMKMNVANGHIESLRKDATTAEFEPACSRDGRYCAFIRQRGVLSLSMAIFDRQSNSLVEVLPPAGFAGMRSPAISPENSRVLYSFADGGRQHIYVTNLQAENPVKLTDSSGIDNWPSFSPDGRLIVFGSSRDGAFEIYVMQRDGSGVRRITHCPFQDIRPRFSPDGQRIAFVSHRDGNSEIYVVNVDGSGLTRVTNHTERDDYPDWHPDGKRLVVVSERNGQHDLYLLNVP